MKILALNGSPRKKNNTYQMLESVLAGAAEAGAETELINLYDLDYQGCHSCMACKYNSLDIYGKCGWTDGLTPVLQKIDEVDALVIGSPVYFADVTAMTRAFLERLCFPVHPYTTDGKSLNKHKIACGVVLTMNVPKYQMNSLHYTDSNSPLVFMCRLIGHHFGSCGMLTANDTFQFDDYSKYVCTKFDAGHKAKVRDEQFPKDLANARKFGADLIAKAERLSK